MNEIPSPEPKLVTAKDGAFRVGVPVHQLSTWLRTGVLYSVGTAARSAVRLYSLKRLRELAAAYHERKARRAAKRGAV